MKKLFKFLVAVFMGFALTSCSITIRSSLNKVELNKEAITLEVGQTTTLTATIKPEELASETTIVWSSLDEKVASVNDKGLVTALKEGTTKIKVTAIRGAVKREDTCTVKVVPSYIPVSGVTLNKQSGSLKVGESLTLVPTVLPNDATNKEIVWASSNESVAAVVDGIVTAISYGTATITVTTVSESKSASFELSVYQTVTGVTLDKVANTINVGESFTLKATVNPEIAQNKEVTWSTSNPHVASVNNGLVTAISSGSALITVTTKDGNYKAICYVIVVKPVTGVTLDSTSLDLIVNEETTLVATVSPSDATNKEVVWASSNSSIVKVDDGKVKALAPGNAVISVITLDGQMKATCNITVTQPVAGVSLNKEEVTIKVDKELTLLATVSPSNATNKDVTWESSNENVASVNNGVVTAHKAGTVTITVSTIDGSYEDICVIHVIQSVESVSLDKQAHSLNINDSFKLEASVLPNDATNKEVIWSSSNPYVASVNNGIVTALKAGTTTITVTTVDGNKTSSCVVTVVTPVAEVTLNKQAHTLKINETVTLSATVSPSDATNKEVIWSSSNESVATVDNGLIKAVGKGQAVITVTTVDGSFEANCIITVLQPVTGVTLDKEEVTIKVGDITVLHEEVLPSDATNKEVIWSSSNENVVTIKNGAVTALSKGEATVTVTTVDGSFKDTCKVIVLQSVSGVSLNKHTHTLNVNETVTLLATVSPSNATNKDVVWSSSNESVATVDNGIVKALSKGTATISVTTVDGLYKDTCVITVLQQVTGVTLSKEEISIKVGDEKVLVATVLPTNASNKDVVWSSSDEDVVTVVDGVVVAHNPGEAIVTVTTFDGSKKASCVISVAKLVENVALNKQNVTLGIGEKDTLVATVLPDNASNKEVRWNSSNTNVVIVDNGVITAVSQGNAVITVTTVEGGLTATCNVTVIRRVSGVSLNVTDAIVGLNETITLVATVSPSNATIKDVVWTSSDENIATVEDGVVTAISTGEVEIKVTTVEGNKVATCLVEVVKFPTSVEIENGEEAYLDINETITLVANVLPLDAYNKDVVWSSSNTRVATVENGVVKALSNGEAIITVRTVYGDKVDTFVIKVCQPVTGVGLDKSSVNILEGQESHLYATVLPFNATNKEVVWSIEDEEVALVNNGTITALKEGTTTVTVTTVDGGFSATCTINVVKNAVHATSVKVTQEEGINSIKVDDTLKLTATVLPANTTDSIAWYSTDENIATVDRTGLVTAHNEGSVTIVVSAGTVMSSYAITVSKITPTITLEGQGVTYLDEYEFTPTSDCNEIIEVTYYTSINGEKGVKLDSKPLNAGEYIVVATIKETHKYNSVSEEVKLVINKRQLDMINVTWSYEEEFVYNTQERKVALVNLPDEVKAKYENNVKTIVGDYKATFTLVYDEDNYELINNEITSLDWSIVKATIDLDDASWNYSEPFTYNTSEYEVKLVDVNPLVSVSYDVNKATNAGNYTAVATLTYDEHNYKLDNVPTLTLDWEIRKVIVTRPDADNRVFTYNASIQTYVLATNTGIYTISGDELTQTNAGTYTIIVSLDDKVNYIWDNETNTNLTYTFVINRYKVTKPVANAGLVYNGKLQTGVYDDSYYSFVEESETGSKVNAGSYDVLIKLDDKANYMWADGTDDDIIVTYEIAKKEVTKPTVVGTYTYNTLKQTLVLDGYNEDIMDISGNEAKDAGNYTAVVTLDDNHKWANGYDDNIAWSIKKATIDLTNATWNYTNSFTYDGSKKVVEIEDDFLPDDVKITYVGNEQTNASGNEDYEATATLVYNSNNYEVKGSFVTLVWKINKVDAEVYFVGDEDRNYSGNVFELPNAYIVDVFENEYELNVSKEELVEFKNVGTYNFVALDPYKNYNLSLNTTSVVVSPASLNVDWSCEDEYTYGEDFDAPSAKLTTLDKTNGYYNTYSLLPSLSVEQGEFKNAGTYTFKVEFLDNNYVLANDTLTVEIKKATIDMSKVTWNYSDALIYNAKEQEITLVNVPALITKVNYKGNKATNVGSTYKATVSFEYDSKNYVLINTVEALDWEIKPLEVEITWNYENSYTYNGLEQALPTATYKDLLGNDVVIVVKENDNKAFVNAVDYMFVASFDENYEHKSNYVIKNSSLELSINKLIAEAPKGLEAQYGQYLRDVQLPDVEIGIWNFNDADLDTKFEEVKDYTFTITFTSTDPNYETNTTDEVIVKVGKANNEITEIGNIKVTYGAGFIPVEFKADNDTDAVITFYKDETKLDGKPTEAGEYRVIIYIPESKTHKEAYKEVTLTIEPRELTISYSETTFVYDAQDHQLEAEIENGKVVGDDIELAVTGPAKAVAVGEYTYTVKLTGEDKANYDWKDVVKTVKINAPNESVRIETIDDTLDLNATYALAVEYKGKVYSIPNTMSLNGSTIKTGTYIVHEEEKLLFDLESESWSISKDSNGVYYIYSGAKYLGAAESLQTNLNYSSSAKIGWVLATSTKGQYLQSNFGSSRGLLLNPNKNNGGIPIIGHYAASNINSDYAIVKLYKLPSTVDVEVTSNEGGKVTWSTPTELLTRLYPGIDTVSLSIEANETYYVKSVTYANETVFSATNEDTTELKLDIPVTKSGTINVTFARQTAEISYELTENYTVALKDSNNKPIENGTRVEIGTTITYVITAVTGYELDSVNGNNITKADSYTDTITVNKDTVISAIAVLKTYDVTPNIKDVDGNNSIAAVIENLSTEREHGSDVTFTVNVLNEEYEVKDVYVVVNEETIELLLEDELYSFKLLGDTEIVVVVGLKPAQKYIIDTTNKNASVTILDKEESYEAGEEIQFTVKAAEGYYVTNVTLSNDEVELTADNGTYSFVMPADDISIIVETALKLVITVVEDENIEIVITDTNGKEIKDLKVLPDTEIVVTVNAADGHEVDKVNGEDIINDDSYTTRMTITENTTISASAKAKEYKITTKVVEGNVDASEVVEVEILTTGRTYNTEISFKVTLNDDDFELKGVYINNEKESLVPDNDEYSFKLLENTTITVEVGLKPICVDKDAATFEFGANGTGGSQVDGNDLGTSKSYEEDGYILALTSMSKVFGPAYDKKGNSAIKLGTSSVAGKFSFTVPAEISKVIIYVAGRGSEKVNISINNGEAITINTLSDNGEYTPIEINTTTNKTITLVTSKPSGGDIRCMIDRIVFYKSENIAKTIKEVKDAIDAIGEVTLEDKKAIEDAETLYKKLTPEQKAKVDEDLVAKLNDAIEEYNNLVDIKEVVDAIDAIGDVALDDGEVIEEAKSLYDALDPNLQSRVSNKEALEAAITRYNNLVAIDKVEKTIIAIGEVTTADDATLNKIVAAEEAYNNLGDLKEEVNEDLVQTLEDARDDYDELKAKKVEALIEAIGEVTTADAETLSKIVAAEKALESLTVDQLAKVSPEAIGKLNEAKEKFDELENEPVIPTYVVITNISNDSISGLLEYYVEGDIVEFTVTPGEDYYIDSVSAGSVLLTPENGNNYKFTMPNEDVTINVVIKEKPVVTIEAGANTTIDVKINGQTLASGSRVLPGTEITYTVIATGEYEINKVNGEDIDNVTTYSETMVVNVNVTISSEAVLKTYTITSNILDDEGTTVGTAGASITGLANSAQSGTQITFGVLAKSGYELVEVKTIVGSTATTLTGTNNVYTFKLSGITEVVVVVEKVIETRTYVFSNYEEGTQYATNEKHVLDDYITVTTTQAHFTSELRLYSSNTNNGYAIIKSNKMMTSLSFNAGNKTDTLNVYYSIDGGVTWELLKGVSITSTSYKDYSVDFGGNEYGLIKLDVAGTQQVRIKNMTISFSETNFIYRESNNITCEDIEVEYGSDYNVDFEANNIANYTITYYTAVNGAKGQKLQSKPTEVGEYIVVISIPETNEYYSAEKEVKLSIKEKQGASTPKEITFNLGANGSASHSDGSSKTSYSETVDGYTLSITSGTNMYTEAKDAKGNSCIKMGSSKNAGSFTIKVASDVNKVIIYVANYKNNTGSIKINGTTYTLKTASDNGEYVGIEVDTSSTKTVTFATGASGDKRCMINTIKFEVVA